jgi:hypothetical protein
MIEKFVPLFNLKTSPDQIIGYLNALDHDGWEQLLTFCRMQGIRPLFSSRLELLNGQVSLPAFVSEELHQASLKTASRNMLVLHYAERALKAFQEADVPLIALKGIYLIETVYHEISSRSFNDIDLMVQKKDIQQAISILEGLGFHLTTYFSIDDPNVDIKHVPPMVDAVGLFIELHWTILEEESPFDIDINDLWVDTRRASIVGVDILSLSPENLLLHLCLHIGYQHRFNTGLRGLWDIALVLDHFEMDWHKVVKNARAWGVERVAWLTLTMTMEILGADVPEAVMADLRPDDVDERMLSQARKQILVKDETASVNLTPDLAALAKEKGIIRRMKVLWSRVFLPRRVLARLYDVKPTSPRMIGCYFRRFGELVRAYGLTIIRIFRKEEPVMKGATEKEAVEKLRQWLGKT